MGILSPWMLLGLLTVPTIVVLYLLRLKRKPVRISSVLLWRQAVDDHQANAPFQKLRRNLLMLVQIVVALLLVGAAVRPYKLVPGMGGKRTVVVLDASASMQATDVKPSRFEAARAVVRRMIDRLGSGDLMALVVVSQRARTACSLTGNRQALRAALAGVAAEDTHGNLKDGAAVAGAIAGGREAAAVFVTDAASAGVEEVRLGKLEPTLIRVGERARNVGLTALSARPSPERGRVPLVYCQLHNADSVACKVTLEFHQGPRLVDAREVAVPAGGCKPLVLKDVPVHSGLLRAHVRERDDLDVDNDAYVFLGSGQALRVLVVSEGNLFLEQAITVDPAVSAERVAPADLDSALHLDVAVLDNCAPVNLPPGNYLFIAKPSGERSPLRVGPEVQDPAVASVLREHPVNQFVDWSRVHFAKARPGRPVPGATALVETRTGALIAARQTGEHRSLALAFELTDTDLPVRADFPIFVANALDWLSGGMQRASSLTRVVATGAVVAAAGSVTAEYPDGSSRKLTETTATEVLRPLRVGVYHVKREEGSLDIAANLLEEAETNLRPGDSLRFAHQEVKQRLSPALVKSELAVWFLLAALLILTGEWWLYHRRP
jgi:hypothetical protein